MCLDIGKYYGEILSFMKGFIWYQISKDYSNKIKSFWESKLGPLILALSAVTARPWLLPFIFPHL